ncbi:hypothetical protein JXA88_05150 [Candidatus Fermentibacteria bacterium]|nr:hypothetical protein [Candidatus Fermentibacteria bacterium]
MTATRLGPIVKMLEIAMRRTTVFSTVLMLLVLLSACDRPGASRHSPKPTIVASNGYDVKESFEPFFKFGSGRFHVAVVQSGEYLPYTRAFVAILTGLSDQGWMAPITVPDDAEMADVIRELNSKKYSDYIDFPASLYFDFEWEVQRSARPEFQRIIGASTNEIDLIISFGTDATRVLSKIDGFRIPVLGDSISNGVTAGIIDSIEDSGKDFLTIRCNVGVYREQVRLFHDLINFKRLGVLYTDTASGRSYAAVDDIEAVAAERGFEVVRMSKYLHEEEGHPEAESGYLRALKELCPQVDAVYLTIQAGFTDENLPRVLAVLAAYKLPSFAMANVWRYVERGVLFGVSETEMESAGVYNAQKIVNILKGIKPRSLNQVFQHIPRVAINLKTAEDIGYAVPESVLNRADEIYGR